MRSSFKKISTLNWQSKIDKWEFLEMISSSDDDSSIWHQYFCLGPRINRTQMLGQLCLLFSKTEIWQGVLIVINVSNNRMEWKIHIELDWFSKKDYFSKNLSSMLKLNRLSWSETNKWKKYLKNYQIFYYKLSIQSTIVS